MGLFYSHLPTWGISVLQNSGKDKYALLIKKKKVISSNHHDSLMNINKLYGYNVNSEPWSDPVKLLNDAKSVLWLFWKDGRRSRKNNTYVSGEFPKTGDLLAKPWDSAYSDACNKIYYSTLEWNAEETKWYVMAEFLGH